MPWVSLTNAQDGLRSVVTVHNLGWADLEVKGFELINPDVFVLTDESCVGRSIGHDGTCTVTVEILNPDVGAVYSDILTVLSNAGNSPTSIALGPVQVPETAMPFVVMTSHFNGVSIEVTVKNTGQARLDIDSFSLVDPTVLKVTSENCTQRLINLGAECQVLIDVREPVNGASYSGQLTAHSNARNSPTTIHFGPFAIFC